MLARFAGEATTDAERDQRLSTVLAEDGAGREIIGKVRETLDTGVALRNVAVYLEREADGKRSILAGYRTGIADAVKARVGAKVRVDAVLKMLSGKAADGNVFCVFVLWRDDGLADIACVELTTKVS